MANSLHSLVAKDGFRLRGTEMSRIDGFSDVVFGFAVTIIVASLEVPKTYRELHETILGFLPFSICFLFLFMAWWAHFRFFRRYGLHDTATILINAALLFTVLFYVYPLKFLFTIFVGQYVGLLHEEPFKKASELRELMVLYSLGFVAVYLLISLLYWNAWRQREELELSPLERLLTREQFSDLVGVACVGLVVFVVALILPPERSANASFCFFLIAVWKTAHGFFWGRRSRALQRTKASQTGKPTG